MRVGVVILPWFTLSVQGNCYTLTTRTAVTCYDLATRTAVTCVIETVFLPSLHELLRNEHNGLIFTDHSELAQQLQVCFFSMLSKHPWVLTGPWPEHEGGLVSSPDRLHAQRYGLGRVDRFSWHYRNLCSVKQNARWYSHMLGDLVPR